MEKFFRSIEKAVNKAILSMDDTLKKTNEKIQDTEIRLGALKRDRSLYERFIDKLDRILSILKE